MDKTTLTAATITDEQISNPMTTAEPSPLRFATKADAVAWIDEHGLDCWPHDGGRGWIAVALTPQGVCAAMTPTTGVILHDW